jgi:peptide/nickel transport system substrate-binding protein
MKRLLLYPLASLLLIQFSLGIPISPSAQAQEWEFQPKPQGTLKVVDLFLPSVSLAINYGAALVGTDENNKQIPWLAKDWRWLNERTIDFKLREGVRFHNGEKFNAEAVRINWEEYRKMEIPRAARIEVIPDGAT